VTIARLAGLHTIELPTPFSVGDVNVYLLEPGGSVERLTLVDTGPDWEATRQALQIALSGLGYAIGDLQEILISHAHPDHCGLAAWLISESGARLSAHPDSQPALESGTSSNQRAATFYRRWLTECGVPPLIQDQIGLDRADSHRYARPVSVDHLLHDGDELRLAGHQWRVLSTPGHAGGLVCFFEPQSRILLSSDHLIAKITSNPIVEPPSPGQSDRPKRLLQYLEQLKRVAALEPAVAYSGHGRPISNVTELVAQRIAFHEARADQVYQELVGHPRTVYDLVQRLFPANLPPVHLFLAVSEVQGHLDLLASQDRADCIVHDPACLWQTR
jgi:glyoxylase-like metal-dependent hydrolase (beta-lactamase superfamily II)